MKSIIDYCINNNMYVFEIENIFEAIMEINYLYASGKICERIKYRYIRELKDLHTLKLIRSLK